MGIPRSSAELIKKAGVDRFQLVNLLSSRVRELMFGAKPLIENEHKSLIHTAIKELLADKIKPQK